jgi:hypothetical protein
VPPARVDANTRQALVCLAGLPPSAALLASQAFLDTQRYARRYLEANLLVLLAETGVPATAVVRVPSLFARRLS